MCNCLFWSQALQVQRLQELSITTKTFYVEIRQGRVIYKYQKC